jgi:hypothetical protein
MTHLAILDSIPEKFHKIEDSNKAILANIYFCKGSNQSR